MSPLRQLKHRWQAWTGEEETPFDGDTPAWAISLVVHLGLLVVLTALFYEIPRQPTAVDLSTVAIEQDLQEPEAFAYSDIEVKEVGANSVAGLTAADSLAQLEEIDSAQPDSPLVEPVVGDIVPGDILSTPVGTELSETLQLQGAAGVGATGAIGAVDRITQEILEALADSKPLLIVWFFDQSVSLSKQRESIFQRLDRIYEELGVVEASRHPSFARHQDKPLLTSVVAFGKEIRLLTPRPTDELAEIKAAVASIRNDDSGVERTFTAIHQATEEFRSYVTGSAPRNIMFITFTDEAGDDSAEMLDKAVTACRRYGIRNFIVGIPSPFGRKEVEVKWIDPDPRFNQEDQWAPVTQGPESLLPERVRIDYGSNGRRESPLDSGFGPFSLTRLAVATGGIYFTVHPNRDTDRPVSRRETGHLSAYLQYFFEPDVMRKYRPDYVTAAEYLRRLRDNRAKRALVEASAQTWLTPIIDPQLRFRRRDEADLARQLTEAQKQAAKLEPKVKALFTTLSAGKHHREELTEPRWQAGYDLAMGQVLALKVRTEGYNIMLAKAKRGMKFQNPRNDTWDLKPSRAIHAGSVAEKEAQQAELYLRRVVEEHPDTPWAKIAEEELASPLGWRWNETFTNVNPPRVRPPRNNNNNPRPRDDQRNVIPPKPRRDPPKL